MMQTLQENFVVAAAARGMTPRYVLFRHALRPSSFSVLTLSAVSLGYLLGGTAIVERIYGLPGLGSHLVASIEANDYPMVQGIVLTVTVIFVLLNLVTEVLYTIIDPRTRRGAA
jgi:peptide/nickel transport system permease protein